jgi:hypothetical protein
VTVAERMQRISKKFLKHPPSVKKTLFILMTLAVWCFFLWRAINAFGPTSGNDPVTFNSDAAIPVLMSNDERPITIFNLYYYGTDRWGAWPFLVTQVIRRTTGYWWSAHSIFVWQTLWLFVGALVIACLSRRDRLLAALVYLITLCLHGETRYLIFELSQLYAWQTTALLLSWYSLRRLFEGNLEPTEKHPVLKRRAWFFLAFLFSYLAIWSSNTSILFLFFLLNLEALRAWLKTGGARINRRFLKPYVLGLISIAAAALLEFLQKWNYHRHGLKHYGQDFHTTFHLDTNYLAQNLGMQFHHLNKLSWWFLYLIPTLVLVALICSFLYAFFKKRDEFLEKLKTAFLDDTLILAIGAYAIAAINFTLVVLVDHVRLNLYDDRYLTLTNVFGPISGMLTIFLLFKLAARSSGLSSYVQPAFILIIVLLLTIEFPARNDSPQYKLLEETARTLSQKAPRAILMGGYWDTYVFTALQPENAMTALPLEGHELRMPWTREMVRQADRVIVAYSRTEPNAPVSTPERLQQYGSSLRLIDPKWYENEWYAFALYVNETQ